MIEGIRLPCEQVARRDGGHEVQTKAAGCSAKYDDIFAATRFEYGKREDVGAKSYVKELLWTCVYWCDIEIADTLNHGTIAMLGARKPKAVARRSL